MTTIQVRRSDNGNISLLKAYLNATFQAFSPTVVPSTLLQSGFSYTFSVVFCNFLGSCNQASQVVVTLDAVVPTVFLPGQQILSSVRSSLITVESAASVSVCPQETSKSYPLQYSWSISRQGIPLLGFVLLSKDCC